jgi:NitT/TauT family transport system permease protein
MRQSANRWIKNLKTFFSSIKSNVIAFLLLLLSWFFLGLLISDSNIIPSPFLVIWNFFDFFTVHFVTDHLLITLFRVLIGFIIAFILGTGIGLLDYMLSKKVSLNSYFIMLQTIPGVVLVIICIRIFGLGSVVPVFLIAFFTLPIIAVNTFNALTKKSRHLEDYIISLGGGRKNLLLDLYLPLLVPTMRSNVTIGLGLALKIIILGEFVGSQNGIGHLLNIETYYYRMDKVFFYLLIIFLIMLIVQIFTTYIFKTLLKKFSYQN